MCKSNNNKIYNADDNEELLPLSDEYDSDNDSLPSLVSYDSDCSSTDNNNDNYNDNNNTDDNNNNNDSQVDDFFNDLVGEKGSFANCDICNNARLIAVDRTRQQPQNMRLVNIIFDSHGCLPKGHSHADADNK